MGKITLRTALAKSLNIPAVELLSEVGIPNAVLFAEHLGISFEGENLSLALALGGFTHGYPRWSFPGHTVHCPAEADIQSHLP